MPASARRIPIRETPPRTDPVRSSSGNIPQRFRSTCDIWRPAQPIDPLTGAVGAETWEKVAASVPCTYLQTLAAERPTEIGRLAPLGPSEGVDEIEFAVGVDVRAGDCLRDVSAKYLTFNAGTVHRVLGGPVRPISIHVADWKYLLVAAARLDHPPAELTSG